MAQYDNKRNGKKGYVQVLKNPYTMETEWVAVEQLTLSDGITKVSDLIYAMTLLKEANTKLSEQNIQLASKYNDLANAYLSNKKLTTAELTNLKAEIKDLGGNV